MDFKSQFFILINVCLGMKLCHSARWIDAKQWVDNIYTDLWIDRTKISHKRSEVQSGPHFINLFTIEQKHKLTKRRSDSQVVPFNLSSEESLVATDSAVTLEGTEVFRVEEKFKGIPVYDAVFTVEVDKTSGHFTGQTSGHVLNGIGHDLNDVQPSVSKAHAITLMTDHVKASSYKSLQSHLYIYKDSNKDNARLVWRISFFFEDHSIPSRPTCFIDAHSGEIIKCYNSLKRYKIKGKGGNEKIGKLLYGIDMPLLDVENRNGKCRYKSKEVKVVDNSHTESEDADIVEFDCEKGASDNVNGAYSPATDAYYFGKMIVNMFKTWVNAEACDILPLQMDVHSSGGFSAYFDGEAFKFSDGDEDKYPFVTVGIAAHEVGHCFTEYHAGFEYTGQSGAIDEAFSDLTGEAAKFYIFGKNDWKAGDDVLKKNDYVRNLCDQSDDGMSVTHTDQYTDDKDVHHVSGIFNKVACEISKSKAWNIKSVFQVFAHANRFYWRPTSGFTDAACGVIKAAYDLGHYTSPVQIAFSNVGIETCSLEGYIRQVVADSTITDLEASLGRYIIFKIKTVSLKYPTPHSLRITTSRGSGDVDLYLASEPTTTLASVISVSNNIGNYEVISREIMDDYTSVYLFLKPKRFTFSGVTLTVTDT